MSSDVLVKNLTTATGQVATTATQISAGKRHARKYILKFCNVGSQTETLVITVSRNGATAVRVKRVVLDPNEEFKLSGFPINLTDSVLAVTTTASSVDYLISIADDNAPYTEETFDSDGRLKSLPYILEQVESFTG